MNERCRHAQRGEWQKQILLAQRVEHLDATDQNGLFAGLRVLAFRRSDADRVARPVLARRGVDEAWDEGGAAREALAALGYPRST